MDALTCKTIELIRGATHDGPGSRTTVFLKGCSLYCDWCQNPEGIEFARNIWWDAQKCIGCGECLDECPHNALQLSEAGLQRDQALCQLCGACVETCPANAITFTDREWTLDELLKEVLKDRDYYKSFGGGVTVSGGEPLCQAPFVAEFFRRLHEEGVHTALDTCGRVSPDAFAAVLPYTDLVLFDVKLMDSALHQRHTRHGNEQILANLRTVVEHIRRRAVADSAHPLGLWIRTPLIPGVTATPENVAAIATFLLEVAGDEVERWELCAFNGSCNAKYEKLGLTWAYADVPLMEQAATEALRAAALSAGFPSNKLSITGLVAKNDDR